MTDVPSGQQIIAGVTYGPANEMTAITGGSYSLPGFGSFGNEARTFNSLKQLTGMTAAGLNVTYAFSTTANNGKISSQTDNISGEQVIYNYDSLSRLASAATQPGFNTPWSQTFGYDGFGNLTAVNGNSNGGCCDSNNRTGSEDANGNPSSVPLPASGVTGGGAYDVENRLVYVGYSFNQPVMYYSYAPGNKRVWRGVWNSSLTARVTDELTFWSVNGQKLGTYTLTANGVGQLVATESAVNYYFGGKLVANNKGWVHPDRLGSMGNIIPTVPSGHRRLRMARRNLRATSGMRRRGMTTQISGISRREREGS